MLQGIGVAIVLAASASGAAVGQAFEQMFERVAVADGVVAYVANESPGGVVQGNITVISGQDASVVIDSGQFPELARRVVADIRASRLPAPKYLVNTHWHGDHLLSNFVFDDAFPGLVVLQHADTARMGPVYYADWGPATVQEQLDYAVKLDAAAQTGVSSKGVRLDDDTREGFRIDAALVRSWAAQAGDTQWNAPDIAITAELSLDLGGRVVSIRHPGKANTAGDLVAWDDTTKTLVTGDIVVSPTPYSFGSWHSEWIDTLAVLRAMKPAKIVPGHGSVMDDDAYLALLQELLTETRTQVRAAIAAGKSLEQIRQDVKLGDLETRFAGDDPVRSRAFRQSYLAPGIGQAWKEARGEPRSD